MHHFKILMQIDGKTGTSEIIFQERKNLIWISSIASLGHSLFGLISCWVGLREYLALILLLLRQAKHSLAVIVHKASFSNIWFGKFPRPRIQQSPLMFSANGVDIFSLPTQAAKLFSVSVNWNEECEKKILC